MTRTALEAARQPGQPGEIKPDVSAYRESVYRETEAIAASATRAANRRPTANIYRNAAAAHRIAARAARSAGMDTAGGHELTAKTQDKYADHLDKISLGRDPASADLGSLDHPRGAHGAHGARCIDLDPDLDPGPDLEPDLELEARPTARLRVRR